MLETGERATARPDPHRRQAPGHADVGADNGAFYIAGLSAGGAMAAIVATAYPDVFAAAGVHSGLPSGAAGNVVEAQMLMKNGASHRACRQSGAGRIATRPDATREMLRFFFSQPRGQAH